MNVQRQAEGGGEAAGDRVKLLPKRTFLSSAGDFMVMI